jgi:hypothetical protein
MNSGIATRHTRHVDTIEASNYGNNEQVEYSGFSQKELYIKKN